MTKLINGELKELYSEPLSSDPDVIAISYALKMAMKKCLEYAVRTRMYADIDNMTEDILDYMAVEMRLVYYDESFSIDVKRSLIKESYFSYIEAGTKDAVEKLAERIYGYGEVTEWFDFTDGEGVPGEFDITTEAQMTPETFEMISKSIESVKNESSHLRRIKTHRDASGTLYIAAANQRGQRIRVPTGFRGSSGQGEYNAEYGLAYGGYFGAGIQMNRHYTIQ